MKNQVEKALKGRVDYCTKRRVVTLVLLKIRSRRREVEEEEDEDEEDEEEDEDEEDEEEEEKRVLKLHIRPTFHVLNLENHLSFDFHVFRCGGE
ncbi:MAG: hypothetical protein AAFU51_18850 [Bacteroidota bacterium]